MTILNFEKEIQVLAQKYNDGYFVLKQDKLKELQDQGIDINQLLAEESEEIRKILSDTLSSTP